jgi:hypothetical protein
VPRHLDSTVEHAHDLGTDGDLNRFFDQAVRHAEADRVDIDEGIVGDTPLQAALAHRERRQGA